MSIAPSAAALAYQSLSGLSGVGGGAGVSATEPAGGMDGFADMLSSQLGGVVERGRAAESAQAALVTGKAEMVDVVTAVAETEVAMETLVSLRDKVISAYEEIMRMPI